MTINFENSTDHIKNMVGDLSNLPPIKSVEFENSEGYLYGGRRRNRGSRCWIELENGYQVSYFSEAGFVESKKHAEMECLIQLSEIDKYLEYVKQLNNQN